MREIYNFFANKYNLEQTDPTDIPHNFLVYLMSESERRPRYDVTILEHRTERKRRYAN